MIAAAALPLLLARAHAAYAGPSKENAPPRETRPSAASEEFDSPDLPPQPTVPPELKVPRAQPWFVRAIVVPQKRGIFLRLPVIDTDPNRGVTVGFMPIWVLKDRETDRIRQIHAPSVTHNDLFGWTPTYRWYYYPTGNSDLTAIGSIGKYEHEAMGKFNDYDFLDRGWLLGLKGQYDVDASNRFFGIGPFTRRSGESNFLRDTIQYHVAVGAPLRPESNWSAIVSHHIAGEKISNGPIRSVPATNLLYPGDAPAHRHQDSELRLALQYDARDNPLTTSRGRYAQLFAETSQRELASEYVFQRYGVDLREFYKTDSASRLTTAARFRGEQLEGTAPFWLLPTLGGKYTQRAYGAGRFTDRGMMTATLEERVTVRKLRMGGVTTEFEVAPIAGLGTVFPTPGAIARRAMRPEIGGAVRAVAKPQVVGSVDFGAGQEGLAVFMDINYSY